MNSSQFEHTKMTLQMIRVRQLFYRTEEDRGSVKEVQPMLRLNGGTRYFLGTRSKLHLTESMSAVA